MLTITENLVEYCSKVSELLALKAVFYFLLIFVVAFNDLSICLPFKKNPQLTMENLGKCSVVMLKVF